MPKIKVPKNSNTVPLPPIGIMNRDNTSVRKNLPIVSFKKPTQATAVAVPAGGNTIKIIDTRKVDSVTGKPNASTANLTRQADVDLMRKIIAIAKSKGIDPYTALAIAHQETGLSQDQDEGNPFHIVGGTNDPGDLDGSIKESIDLLKSKFDYARKLGKRNEADIIQAYNGYGKVGKGTEGYGGKIYGLDVTNQPIDMNQNPVYGKRIIDIRDNILKANPEIVKLVDSTK